MKRKSITRLWDTLTAPCAEDPDIARQEYMTRVISLITAVIGLVFGTVFLIGWFFSNIPIDSLLIICAIMLIMAIGIRLTYSGYWRSAGYLPPLLIFATAVYGSYIGGPGAPAMALYALAIIMTAILIGRRAMIGALALSIACYVGIGSAHLTGIIPLLRTPESAFYNRAIILSATLTSIAALVWFLISQYKIAIGKARTMTRELEEIASELSETNLNLETEIAERRRAEDALQENEERYRLLFESSREAIVILEAPPSLAYVAANRATLEMFRIDPANIPASPIGPWDLVPEFQPDGKPSRDTLMSMMQKAVTDGWCFFEFRNRRFDGEEFPATILLSKFALRGKTLLQASMRDITERKRAEEQIRTSLMEKEVLLKEIHHRVKNNFQIIISLLHLQSGGISDVHLLKLFNESVSRIRAMALVHEELYQSENISDIDFGTYIRTISEELYASYASGPDKPELAIDSQEILLGIDQAIPCGLILNELVTNSLKYAFPAGGSGHRIRVSIQRSGANAIVLAIGDNGVGLPDKVEISSTETLGLQLVNVLIKQIRGSCRIDRQGGTLWEITFPARHAAAPA